MWQTGALTSDTYYRHDDPSEYFSLSDIANLLDPHPVLSVTAAQPLPPSTRPPAKRTSSCAVFLLLAIIAFVVILIANQSGTDKKNYHTPNVSIRTSDSIVEITNAGTESWSAMTVYINGQPPFTYKWDGPAPGVGQSKSILLREFDKKGERFDPFKYKVTEVWVGGGGYDYSSFNTK